MTSNINYSLFFKANLFLTVIIFLLFLQYNVNYNIISFPLVFFGAVSSAVILYLLLYLLLFILNFTNKIILYFSGIVFSVVNIFLVIDFFIFRLYSFHINAMVINILTSPDAMDSIQAGFLPILLLLILIICFVIFEIYLVKNIFQKPTKYKYNLNKKINKITIIPLILIVLSEKVSYGMFSLFNKNEVVSKFKVIPLYQPLTFSRVAAKYFDFKPDVEAKNTINKNGILYYPKKDIVVETNPNKFNVFIFASDSVRNDILNKETAPFIEEFKKDSIVFNNHYSGGNATRFGIFSLMYGVNSTYWFSFLAQNKGAVIFDVLKQLDYQINIITSTNTNWPEFRKTCYVNILDSIKDDFKGSPWEKDRQSTDYFLKTIDSYNQKKPIFSFVFLDSPHGYSFPEGFNKFNASKENINYLTIGKNGKNIKSVFSRYKNSVLYNDYLFKKMIIKLKEKGLYDDSLIIYTSDHGEEFYEYGFFGHNSSFSKAQTNSPFIIKLPKDIQKKIILPKGYPDVLTSHNDVVPSILSLIGVKNDTKDYSNGQNIFTSSFKRDFVFNANWNNNAIITKDFTYLFSNLPNKMFDKEIRNTQSYEKVESEKISSKLLLNIIDENRYFLK